MRKRFEQQHELGRRLITDIELPVKSRDAFSHLVRALYEIFINPEYNEKIYSILESKLFSNKQKNGRPGMDLWQLFVLAQTRHCLDLDYDTLYHMVNNDKLLRHIMGIEYEFSFQQRKVSYQNIYDNLNLITEDVVMEINDVVVTLGHKVFKKKETEALRCKSDSFVLESNVHFPTDYNLLWDSGRKCIDCINKLLMDNNISGWRKIKLWRRELKNQARAIGEICAKGGPGKEDRAKAAALEMVKTASVFSSKISTTDFPLDTEAQLGVQIQLEYYKSMLDKHIDLLERRLVKGEKIPHHEKVFSIFEPYSEWITKGKKNPSVEIGKNIMISTDQYNLIVDYKVMEKSTDPQELIPLATRILSKYKVSALTVDRRFYNKENKELLELEIETVVMPKHGKLSAQQKEEQSGKLYKKLKNRHSAVESNINELENRGLSRCPDKGIKRFKRFVGLTVVAYNLKKIGKYLLELEDIKLKQLRA